MIDEFQDIDAIQYQLMEVLAAYHKNLFVVGDPDQTIYTWRGANVRFLLDFDERFQGAHTIMMLENYRSVPQVLEVANSLIAKNKERIPKDLVAVRSDHGQPFGVMPSLLLKRRVGLPREWNLFIRQEFLIAVLLFCIELIMLHDLLKKLF